MVSSCVEGHLLFLMFTLLITSGEGPTYLKVIDKGQIIAYREMHMTKLYI